MPQFPLTLGIYAPTTDGLDATLADAEGFADVIVATDNPAVVDAVQGRAAIVLYLPPGTPFRPNHDAAGVPETAVLHRAAYHWTLLLRAGERVSDALRRDLMAGLEEATLEKHVGVFVWTPDGYDLRLRNKAALSGGTAGKFPASVGIDAVEEVVV